MTSKRYKQAHEMIDKTKRYELNEAIELLLKYPKAKFDETVELHMNLGVDPRKADQQIRNSLVLPNGSGQSSTVLVFAEGDKADEAKEAGADFVGVDEYVEKINSGWFDFDVAITTPNLMGKIGRLGRVLGPRSLMPNPKDGTVTMNIKQAVADAKGGKITYRIDKFSNLHVVAGKLSFTSKQLTENVLVIVLAIIRERPAALKGIYINSINITSTMGPGIKLDVTSISKLAKK
jgi:large subunit ribosomal protein L1